jgi:hypothetical protein
MPNVSGSVAPTPTSRSHDAGSYANGTFARAAPIPIREFSFWVDYYTGRISGTIAGGFRWTRRKYRLS